MERDLKLKQFSGALFSYVYREYNAAFDLPVKLPHVFNRHSAGDCSEDEGKAVMKLCLALRSVFQAPFSRAFPQIQRSVKHFMTYLTSRCLKLCGDDLFLSFVMICAFIAELNLFCWINSCFTFMSTAPKCLIAIFNRRLKKEFYANGGWEKLRLFCETFVQMNGKGLDPSNLPTDDSNGDFINQSLLSSIEELLEENSSDDDDDDDDEEEDEDSSESDPLSNGTEEMDEESEESEAEVAPANQHSVSNEDSESDESESNMDSDDSESESEESEEEDTGKPNEVKGVADSDDSESSEDSDPSSMSDDEESESEDSESDAAPNTEQIECLKPIMQENLSVEKKIL